jgi:hypothetical protein
MRELDGRGADLTSRERKARAIGGLISQNGVIAGDVQNRTSRGTFVKERYSASGLDLAVTAVILSKYAVPSPSSTPGEVVRTTFSATSRTSSGHISFNGDYILRSRSRTVPATAQEVVGRDHRRALILTYCRP